MSARKSPATTVLELRVEVDGVSPGQVNRELEILSEEIAYIFHSVFDLDVADVRVDVEDIYEKTSEV